MIYLICICVSLLEFMCTMCLQEACGAKRGHWIPWKANVNHVMWVLETKPSLQEQYTILTAESSLQPQQSLSLSNLSNSQGNSWLALFLSKVKSMDPHGFHLLLLLPALSVLYFSFLFVYLPLPISLFHLRKECSYFFL